MNIFNNSKSVFSRNFIPLPEKKENLQFFPRLELEKKIVQNKKEQVNAVIFIMEKRNRVSKQGVREREREREKIQSEKKKKR